MLSSLATRLHKSMQIPRKYPSSSNTYGYPLTSVTATVFLLVVDFDVDEDTMCIRIKVQQYLIMVGLFRSVNAEEVYSIESRNGVSQK